MCDGQKNSVSLPDIEGSILSEHYFTAERVPHLRGAESLESL